MLRQLQRFKLDNSDYRHKQLIFLQTLLVVPAAEHPTRSHHAVPVSEIVDVNMTSAKQPSGGRRAAERP